MEFQASHSQGYDYQRVKIYKRGRHNKPLEELVHPLATNTPVCDTTPPEPQTHGSLPIKNRERSSFTGKAGLRFYSSRTRFSRLLFLTLTKRISR
jgi:hypothetical protein